MRVDTLGVIGAGQMGAGIAQVAAQADVDVLLYDVIDGAARKGREGIERNLARLVERGRFKSEERDRVMSRIREVATLDEVHEVDFVVEA
ncbi:MAG TPA: 3-hydroxyacyl-CoA dehydrogenase NAD-binding domain-containing protein, partial [Candidatus Binataceae bacterium]